MLKSLTSHTSYIFSILWKFFLNKRPVSSIVLSFLKFRLSGRHELCRQVSSVTQVSGWEKHSELQGSSMQNTMHVIYSGWDIPSGDALQLFRCIRTHRKSYLWWSSHGQGSIFRDSCALSRPQWFWLRKKGMHVCMNLLPLTMPLRVTGVGASVNSVGFRIG